MQKINGEVKWGIIGVGDVCEVKSGPAFSKVPNSQLVAVMRRNEQKAADYAARHNVSKYYSNVDDIINDPEVNAIYIATPPNVHMAYAEKAIKAGKPVYIEKPVALSAVDCDPVIEAANTQGIRVTAAHYRRRLGLFMKVKELINANVLGDVRAVSLRMFQSPNRNVIADTDDFWRIRPDVSGGGLFHDLAPHQLDIIYDLFGSPLSISGSSANQAKLSEAPDFAKLDMQYANGMHFSGMWSFSVAEDAVSDVCEIIGNKGLLRFSFFRDGKLFVSVDGNEQVYDFEFPQHIQQPMITDVVRYFRGEDENPCSLEEARESMAMIDATFG